MTLKQELDAFVAQFSKQVPPDIATALQKSINDLKASGIVERALKAGDLAPDFTLPNARGQRVALSDLMKRGPLVLSFYRGGWCPYCSMELRAYQKILPEIRALGAQFVAISPQTPDNSLSTAEKNGLEFEVLSDHRNEVARQFGIAYAIPEIVKAIGAKYGTDFATINGADDGRLPISATYVIGTDRRIALASIDPDFRVRLEPADAVTALRRLVEGKRVA